MRKNCKKLAVVLCMMICMGGTCTGCTTSDINDTQIVDVQSTSEEHKTDSREVVEKTVEIELNSDEKIEYSLEGAAGEETEQGEK